MMRSIIKKITESFPEHRYDMETTTCEWVIFFWEKNTQKELNQKTFFFELPNVISTEKIKISPKVKILIDSKWETFEDENVDTLIEKTKEKIKN